MPLPSRGGLAQDGKNLLKGWEAGKGDDLAERFLAGVVAHLPALQAFTTPTVLGYERLKPGVFSTFLGFICNFVFLSVFICSFCCIYDCIYGALHYAVFGNIVLCYIQLHYIL